MTGGRAQHDRGGGEMSRVGAGNRVRTGDLNLGKVALYQLSYSRNSEVRSPQQRSAKAQQRSAKESGVP